MKAYVLLAEGFEEIEAISVIDVLRRAQIEVITVSITDECQVTGSHNIAVIADMKFEYDSLLDGDVLILPGGMPGTNNLYSHSGLLSLINFYFKNDKWLAAICAAPLVFGRMGILKGRSATCFPGYEEELEGAKLSTDKVVQSEKIITSRGAGTAMDFALKLVEILKGKELSVKLGSMMQYTEDRV